MTDTATEKESEMTAAEHFADALHNDGRILTTDDGRSLEELARDLDPAADVSRHDIHTRYTFGDGSIIVECNGAAWDLGLAADCYCWDGSGHSPDCHHALEDVHSVR